MLLTGPLAYGAESPDLDQTTRLAALGKVWGLLKYYHPEVAKGEIDVDALLVNAIPGVKAAVDYDSFNQEIDNLIQQAGDVSNEYNSETPAHPNEALFKWLKDETVFSDEVVKKLTTLQKKHVPVENYWVQTAFTQGNATFNNEKRYDQPYYPDENFRLLGLFRYWNAVQYFFAYHDDMDQDWDTSLREFIPRVIAAGDAIEYGLVIKELATRLNDSHAFVYGGYLNWYFGFYQPPVEARYIEGKTVITRTVPGMMDPGSELLVGDIILKTHNQDIEDFRNDNLKDINASNQSVVDRNLCDFVIRGRSTQLAFTVLRGGFTIDITVKSHYYWDVADAFANLDQQLDHWKILPGNIGYVHMGIAEIQDVAPMMEAMKDTKAIIFDIRNYPNFILYYLCPYLNPGAEAFCQITYPSLDYPGEYLDRDALLYCSWYDNPDYYKGRVIILLDDRTQSRAEFVTMAIQTAPDSTVIGSQTAGADGNVSFVWLPGYIITYFTGLGIYYPDYTPTQRIGIVPDINIRPTVTGIQSGKDEVLERAISFIENNQ
jgi:hypothetical protein